MYDNKFLPKLSENLLEILEDNEFYDITIEVGNTLCKDFSRSYGHFKLSFLRRILSTYVNKKKDDGILVHIKLPNILPETSQMVLRYIYGGRLSLEEYDTSDIIKILIAANELNLQELITHLQSLLIENKKNWMEQNFNLIFKTSFDNDSFLKLQNFCIELMSNEPEKIFNSIDFISLSKKSLISLIQHDKIQMNVIQDDFDALKNTLHQFIPFIKFFNLKNKEFLSKVYPYKKIIPKDLRENLIQHFIDRPNNEPESKIMINEINSKIIKIKGSNEILGGYNPIIWKSDNSFGSTKDSFIFSFKNKESVENHVLSRVNDERYATKNDPSHGPIFGGYEFLLRNNNSVCVQIRVYYEKLINECGEFFAEEYEIFKIKKD
ncbi:hypothetical protein RclHR1_03590014 [Rhizophagus clarus]|uniref:BTB domain-containing protein n=1 Tax=Rhizophagus clarus TaxID=94130 RepID=A0A2Z6RRN0_9GLOM|nr:hypothetical protein RclHR1_03590014 [Rhizophagus clarus]